MNWSTLATLWLFATAFHWTVARSTIMRWFWGASWLPSFLSELLECPACSGFWLGCALALIGLRPFTTGYAILDIGVAGLLALLGVPVVEAILLWGLDRSAIH
jgi:hypothetical protein